MVSEASLLASHESWSRRGCFPDKINISKPTIEQVYFALLPVVVKSFDIWCDKKINGKDEQKKSCMEVEAKVPSVT
jgi:hypothetical protein